MTFLFLHQFIVLFLRTTGSWAMYTLLLMCLMLMY